MGWPVWLESEVDTLATELANEIGRCGGGPRINVDTNVPAGLVAFMRRQLGWDLLCVKEHGQQRRARDTEHSRLARQWRRTLASLDRDYIDERRFPPDESGGVAVLSAPGERAFRKLPRRFDGDGVCAQVVGQRPPGRTPVAAGRLQARDASRVAGTGDREPYGGRTMPSAVFRRLTSYV